MTISDNTVVLVTGARIGRTLVETFLLRPRHTVIGSIRDAAVDYTKELEALPKADGSRLQLVKIESSNSADPAAAVKDLTDIDHIDVVVANAGGAGENGIISLDVVSSEIVTDVFTVNAIGPLALYQAVKPLLEKSQAPKWVSVTSAAGSIGRLELHRAHIVPAYGIAKAGLNWITTTCSAIHSANKSFIAFAVHPGLVQTESGNRAARGMGLPQAPNSQRQSIDAILGLIDNSTRETTSGKFFNVIDGMEIPW
ncbi:Short-chain dehydrogenase/reductase SDR [Penicillium fimorum]|uniref:Short-chain dehydrogenase/reductase SDR n=1 Tax=Penicillium fimorum TaxID=1882269 RepID=A0A9X0C8V9_9EURO|nr:Short-chain dehydrogenase/reductase SDR [Penicillium fimorum]